MNPIPFAIIGGGWRAEFFLRVAHSLPNRFRVSGMLVRDAEKGRAIEENWQLPTYRTLDETLGDRPRFVVVSVPWGVSLPMLTLLADRGMPALAETPPAPDIAQLAQTWRLVQNGARIQVAEQYHLQPLHAARIGMARSGRLGRVTQAQVSAAHGYHGVSLIRRLLDIAFENATITAQRFKSPIVAGPGRSGPPQEERVVESSQVVAYMDFGDKMGVFDFSGSQYFAIIRSPRVLVRGDRGEINNTTLRYLQDFRTPITTEISRDDAGREGDLSGYYHRGYLAGGEWVYRNPFTPARLADDEIAIAACMEGMVRYIETGEDYYSVAAAAQDHYLGMLIDQAAEKGEPVKAVRQPWADDGS